MFSNLILTASALSMVAGSVLNTPSEAYNTLAKREFSLEKRYNNEFVNGVFKDNILLTLAYLRGITKGSGAVNWDEVKKPFTYTFSLEPGETFAYHDTFLPEYKEKVKLTTNAHFAGREGFKSDGYLMGDGVCHLASLIYWTAVDAKLNAIAPVNHDFAVIPQVPKEYGVSVYATGQDDATSQKQNLYITNNKAKAIEFKFDYDGTSLKIEVIEPE